MKNKINVADFVELKERLETKKVHIEVGNFQTIMKELQKSSMNDKEKSNFE